jgi:polyisoprenoid-binding protein YceI
VDARHSAISFTAEHVTLGSVTGEFREFDGALEVDRDGDVWAHGTVKVESLDTGVLEREQQLLSPGHLDVHRYPEIHYQLLAFRPTGDTGYRILGELDIRGVTRQIVLTGTVQGPIRGPRGEERLALELGGWLSRQDYGLRWNEFVDGSPVVGDTVRLAVNLSLARRSDWDA